MQNRCRETFPIFQRQPGPRPTGICNSYRAACPSEIEPLHARLDEGLLAAVKKACYAGEQESFRSSRKRRASGHRPNVALDALMLTDRGSATDSLVPAVGIEPTTNGLQNRCSTN